MGEVIATDVVVLGVGTCGEDLALQLLDAGLDVVGVEAALVGGECPYWACLPSKRMIRASNLVADVGRANGVAGELAAEPNWPLLAEQVRAEVTGDRDDASAVKRFTMRGGTLIKGRGRLVGPQHVDVGGVTFEARRGIVISTGSSALIPQIPGLGDVPFWTNHEFVSTEVLPRSLTVLGGGAIGCELGQVAARFGCEVSIIEGGPTLLPRSEPEAASVIRQALEADGIAVHSGRSVVNVAARTGATVVTLDNGDEVTAERLLLATGRFVNLTGLGLDQIGVDATLQSIPVDEKMRVAERVWAIGDVTGKAMFTHMGLRQAAVVVAEILGDPSESVRYDAVPAVTFTDPEVGAVGFTEKQAQDRGMNVTAIVKQLPATFRGWLHAVGNAGFIKLVVCDDDQLLVGATVVGPSGGEVLGMLNLAVHARVPLSELQSMIYAFPTFYGGVGEAIGAYGRGLTTVLDPDYRGIAQLDR